MRWEVKNANEERCETCKPLVTEAEGDGIGGHCEETGDALEPSTIWSTFCAKCKAKRSLRVGNAKRNVSAGKERCSS
eukprot:6092216-Pyramimonas_sp.AAC.1